MSGNLHDILPIEPACPPLTRDGSRAVRLACLLLVLAVVVVFGRAVNYNFINCDDSAYVTCNPHVNTGFTRDNVRWALTAIHSSNWHPLTWLSHILDIECYGLWAGGHHLSNVVLHAAAVVLLFLALRQLTATFWRSLLVAAMFAVHPLRAESVAWVAERKDVLSGLFWMLTLLLYAWSVRRPSVARRLAVLAVFVLGLMAKSMLVTLPFVLLLLDFWPLGRWRPKRFAPDPAAGSPDIAAEPFTRLVLEKLPLFVAALVVGAVVAAGQRGTGATLAVGSLPLDVRLANAAVSYVAYLWKMLWPVDLAIVYPHPAVIHPGATQSLLLQGLLAAIVLTAVTAVVLRSARRRPYLVVGWLWYLGTLLPVIGVVQIGSHAMADRYTYLPMIGIFIMIAWGAADLVSQSRWLRVASGVAAAGVLLLWIAVAARQVSYWSDSFAVFRHAIAVTDDNYFAHNALGVAYETNGQDERSLAEYEKAVAIAPSYASANVNLGIYWKNHGQYDKAQRYLRAAVDANPFGERNHAALEAVYVREKWLNKTIAALRRSVEENPHDPQDCLRLADLLSAHGKTAEAAAELERFLARNPDNAAVRAKLRQTQPSQSSDRGESRPQQSASPFQ
jgi:protein O-mannosyl-transferase